MNNYYVYALCYPIGIPFYIGKGKRKSAGGYIWRYA